jgi:periplasmic protein CpxP/Spy
MKKLMIIAVLASMTLATQAQEKDRKTPEERAKLRTEHMTKELALSPEQQAKVEAINLKYADQVEAVRSEREAERTAKREAAKAMHDAHDAEMKAVLTADQYTKWVAKKQEAKAKHVERREQMREDRKGN